MVAVKPQMFREAGPALKQFTGSNTLVVSIMAGTPMAALEAVVGGSVVRAMPNTPAAIGRGITVAVAAKKVSATQRAIADALLRATGSVEWVDQEGLMDAVTAVSGSGPAYVFLLAEELARAGVAAGLPAGLATKLARETVAGSGELLHRSELASATLRQNVTSPGGTTAAALEVLMGSDGMETLMITRDGRGDEAIEGIGEVDFYPVSLGAGKAKPVAHHCERSAGWRARFQQARCPPEADTEYPATSLPTAS